MDSYQLDYEDLEFSSKDQIQDIDLSRAPSESFLDKSFPATTNSLTGGVSTTELGKVVSKWMRLTEISQNPQLFLNGVVSHVFLILGTRRRLSRFNWKLLVSWCIICLEFEAKSPLAIVHGSTNQSISFQSEILQGWNMETSCY